MGKSRRPHPGSSIASAMIAVAAAAVLIVSPARNDIALFDLCMLVVEFALPVHLLLLVGRRKSVVEISAAATATVYLLWGALFRFFPHDFGRWQPRDPLLEINKIVWERIGSFLSLGYRLLNGHIAGVVGSFRTFKDLERWHWGALAVFYAAMLAEAAVRGRRRRPWASAGGAVRRSWYEAIPHSVPPAAELVLAVWVLRNCYGWLSGVGAAGLAVLAAVEWRPRPAGWTVPRLAARVVGLAPAVTAGTALGLFWSLVSWPWGVAAVLGSAVALARRKRGGRRRPSKWTLALTALWAFALSAQPVEVLKPFLRVPAAVRSIVPTPFKPW